MYAIPVRFDCTNTIGFGILAPRAWRVGGSLGDSSSVQLSVDPSCEGALYKARETLNEGQE